MQEVPCLTSLVLARPARNTREEPTCRPLGEVLRDEMVMRDRIADALRDGPKTIPEIAETLSAPTQEVTVWVMAMRRYGALAEVPKAKADDYFQYRMVR